MTYGEESGGSSTLPGGNIVAPARRRRCAHPRPSRQWAEMEREALARLILDQLPRFRSRLYLADAEALAQLLRRSPMAEVMSGDYAWSLCFEPAFVASLCWEGFLPICSELGGNGAPGLFVLMPKLHTHRCVLEPSAMHIPRKVRKRASAYRLTVGQAFEAVVDGCAAQHRPSWLFPPLRAALSALSAPSSLRGVGGATPCFVTFELWTRPPDGCTEPAQLVAGDLGCVVGRSYTSFSGFHTASGSGSVQLALTGALLQRAGFGWWDLGQEHGYKSGLGAAAVPRSQFLRTFRRLRAERNRLAEVVGPGGDASEASALPPRAASAEAAAAAAAADGKAP